MPRYARFFRPADNDADHDQQLARWAALGGAQQRFVLGSMLFELGATLEKIEGKFDTRGEQQQAVLDQVAEAMQEMAGLSELLANLDEEQVQERLPRESEQVELDEEAPSDVEVE